MKKRAVYFLGKEYFNQVYSASDRAKITNLCEVIGPVVTPENWHSHEEILNQAEIIFSGWGMTRIDEEMLACFTRVEAIFFAGG